MFLLEYGFVTKCSKKAAVKLDCGAKSQKTHQKKRYETQTVGGYAHHGL
jgi:hypothetical protein